MIAGSPEDPDEPSRPQQRAERSLRLRPYQEECLQRIRARYRDGARRVLVSLPTGTGKTVVFAAMPAFFEMKKRMLVLAHREELLAQAAAKFAAAAEIAPFTELAWCTAPDGGYRLNLADGEWIGLREDNLGRWCASLENARDRTTPMPEPRMDVREAVGAVDKLVRRHRSSGLTRGQASWMITMLDRPRPRRS